MKRASLILLIVVLMAGIAKAQTVTGSGAAGAVPQFTGSSTIGNSPISVSGGNVGIGTTIPISKLQVVGFKNYHVNYPIASDTYSYGDPSNFYLLLHPAYSSGAPIGEHYVMGKITAIRGGQGQLNRKVSCDVNVAAAYSSNRGSVTCNIENWALVTVTHNGIAYLALQPPVSSALFNMEFTGYFLVQPGELALAMVSSDSVNNVAPFIGDAFSVNGNGYYSGNVGIGTTTPQYKLDVGGQIRSSSGGIVFPDGSTQTTAYNSGAAAQSAFSASSLQSIGNGDGAGEIDLINKAKTANGIANRWSIYNMTGGYGNSLQFWNYDTIGCATGGMCASRFTIMDSGNVGIGTTSPTQFLQVGDHYSQNPSIMIGGSDGNNNSTGYYALLFGAWRDVENIASGIVATPTWTCCGGYPASGYSGVRTNTLSFYTAFGLQNPAAYSPNMVISGSTGYVGVGTANPSARMEVNGGIKLTSGSGGSIVFQDGTTQSTAYTGVLCGGDYAESIDVTGDRTNYAPGDVLVIDPDTPGKFLKSAEPYSTAVLGVYSTKPGVLGRRQTTPKSSDEVPMAMVGIVPTKVSAENGAIKPGDLLVTSSTLGYAMKGTDRSRMLGAVIGKALAGRDSGTGIIEVGITLQ